MEENYEEATRIFNIKVIGSFGILTVISEQITH